MTPMEDLRATATAGGVHHAKQRPGVQVIATAQVLPAEHCGYGTTHRSAARGAVVRAKGKMTSYGEVFPLTMDGRSTVSRGGIVKRPAFRVNRPVRCCFSLSDSQDEGAAGSTARTAKIT